MTILKKRRVIFLTHLFVISFLVLLFVLHTPKFMPHIYAYGDSIQRTTKYQVMLDSDNSKTTKKPTKIVIKRSVKLISSSLELPSSNHEYFNVCPADGKVTTLQNIKTSIQAYGEHNRQIPFGIQGNGSCWLVSVPYEHSVRAYRTYNMHIEYIDPSVAVNRGGVLEISYPRLKNKPLLETSRSFGKHRIYIKHTIYIQFIMDKQDFSKFHIYVADGKIEPLKPDVSSYNNKVIASYNLKDVWKTGIYAILGNTRYIKFSIRVPNQNKGFLTGVDNVIGFKQVVLPRSNRQTGQMVYYSIIDPKPLDVQISDTGNLIATFPAGKDILIQGYASITYKKIDFKGLKQVKFDNYTINRYLKEYVQSGYPYWPVDSPQIQSIASKLKLSNVFETVVNDVNFVATHLKYNDNIDFSNLSRKGALQALSDGSGVCMEFSDLLLSILRAQGIATRASLGNVLTRFVDTDYTNVGHQWVEVYFPNQGWIIVDPTLSDQDSVVINQNLNYFTYVNASNINDLTQLKCFSWTKSCNDIQLEVDFVPTIPSNAVLQQEADLLLNKRSITDPENFNTFVALDKIHKIEKSLNAYVFSNKLPELNVTTLYVILFVSVYFVIYVIIHIIRIFVRILVRNLYYRKMERMALHSKRIVETIHSSTPGVPTNE